MSSAESQLSYPTPIREASTEVDINFPPPPQNKETAPFLVLSSLFDKLQRERKSEKRQKLLNSWFNHWRKEKGYDLYPVLRLILPYRDKERTVYGLKEKNLAKAYIRLIPLGLKDPDAVRLLQWKRPTERERFTSGDFSSILHEVISKRSSVIKGTLTIDDLNRYLDEITENIGKQDKQSKILQKIYNRATPDEQRWIVRIILKDMNISVKDTSVFAVFHPDAQDLYNMCSDLKKVSWGLWDPNRRLGDEDKRVHLFRAFTPMLCRRPTKLEDSVKEMQGKTFFIEEKLDGERMQLHKRGDEFFYCSRKGKDYTYLYGGHAGIGSLTPFIASAFDPRVDEIILDGEMLVWDPISGRNLPFGTLKTAALDRSKEHNPRPCFKVFDLLYLNGQSLLRKSCKFRKRNLRTCFSERQGHIEFVTEYQGESADDVRERMEIVMETRGEGLILKHPDGEYVLNGRNKDWIKVKPEYMDNMGETVDVIVLGGEFGRGKRRGGVSTLLVGVLDDRYPVDRDGPKYSTFVWIGSGLSFADFVWIRSKPWKEFDPKNPPLFLQTVAKTNDDKPDVYLEPKDSFILRVKAAEITPSTTFHVSLTMRFPRALAIRDDLDISDCLTLSAVLNGVRSGQKRKMSNESPKQVKKRKINKAKKPLLMPEFSSMNLKEVPAESEIFEGMKFLISPDPKSRTAVEEKWELMKLVKAHGGMTAQLATNQESLLVVYSGTTTPFDIKRIIEKTGFDIIRPQWIHDCIQQGELVPLRKKYFFHASPERMEDEEYDLSDSDDESAPRASTISSSLKDEDEVVRALEVSKASGSELEFEHSEWFKVELGDPKIFGKVDDSETEEDNDSDNQDLQEPDTVEDDDSDEWFTIPREGQVKSEVKAESITTVGTQSSEGFSVIEAPQNQDTTVKPEIKKEVKMGEDDSAMQYDQDMIFRHLCFYIDSPANARANGMQIKPNLRNEHAITEELEKMATLVTSNGGRVAGLNEPKLTHVVVDKRDASRRVELMKRTSKPKRRYLVVSEFITACLEESTLLDEEEFIP